ncbi:uncharacterized protein PAC_18753 [Phialocephala subalpina]|uniref:Cytochrome b561 domain-containing protein n=1 Tax=Phialocephala subalpina TaxID=576137 RepID=A0A1L7XUZ5_9HELO|nr:uncharacterized protein PAC_18753 [Phialocephala subalpina]
MRKIYHPLVIIFGGAMLGFILAGFSYMNVTGDAAGSYKSNTSPGESYHYHTSHYRIGIILHLAGCLPARFLAVCQFVPVIRHKAIIFHRINGYIAILLALIVNAGALMIVRRAFSGGLDVQSRLLQIDQHRAWMLRSWFYFGTIITTRLFMICSATIITRIGSCYQIQTCGEVAFIFSGSCSQPQTFPPPTLKMYPQCVNGTENTVVAVNANMNGMPEQVGAGLGLSFGMGLWFAILVHALGIEWFLWLSPAEATRLGNVSYGRGSKRPSNSGLTVDRFGDAERFRPVRTGEFEADFREVMDTRRSGIDLELFL